MDSRQQKPHESEEPLSKVIPPLTRSGSFRVWCVEVGGSRSFWGLVLAGLLALTLTWINVSLHKEGEPRVIPPLPPVTIDLD